MDVANTLVYYDTALMTAIKCRRDFYLTYTTVKMPLLFTDYNLCHFRMPATNAAFSKALKEAGKC
jgi:hypothetical protein